MKDALLLGTWRMMISVPPALCQEQMARETQADLAFMTADHHRVRDFAVRELPRFGRLLRLTESQPTGYFLRIRSQAFSAV